MIQDHAPLLVYLFSGLSSILIILLGFLMKGWMAQLNEELKSIHKCQDGLRDDVNRIDRRLTRVETKVGLFHEQDMED